MHNLRRVAFAGLGIMGAPMAANLVRAGLEVAVYTRTREKAERFAAEHDGARAAATPADAARDADAFMSIVPDVPQVEEVLFGERGAASALPDGALVVEMSTIAPTASKAISERVAPPRSAAVGTSPRPR
jgi:2-hydroxy-3-oxopropionate reductase